MDVMILLGLMFLPVLAAYGWVFALLYQWAKRLDRDEAEQRVDHARQRERLAGRRVDLDRRRQELDARYTRIRRGLSQP